MDQDFMNFPLAGRGLIARSLADPDRLTATQAGLIQVDPIAPIPMGPIRAGSTPRAAFCPDDRP